MKSDGDEKARCLTTLSRLEDQHKRALDMVQDESTRLQVCSIGRSTTHSFPPYTASVDACLRSESCCRDAVFGSRGTWLASFCVCTPAQTHTRTQRFPAFPLSRVPFNIPPPNPEALVVHKPMSHQPPVELSYSSRVVACTDPRLTGGLPGIDCPDLCCAHV